MYKRQVNSSDEKTAVVTAFPATKLSPGTYRLIAEGQDLAEPVPNAEMGEISFTVLGSLPNSGFDGLMAGSTVSANRWQVKTQKFVNLSAMTVSRSVDMAYLAGGGFVEIYVNNQLSQRMKADDATGRFTSQVPLVEGNTTLRFVTIDSLLRRASPFAAEKIVLDTQPPIIESVQPGNGAEVAQLNTIRAVLRDSTILTTNVSGLNMDSIQIVLDDLPVPVDNPKTDKVDGYQFSLKTGELVIPVTQRLVDGSTHRVWIQVADAAGNLTEQSSSFTVKLAHSDQSPPVISGVMPENGATLGQLAGSDLVILALVSDVESGIASVQVRLDGNVISTKKVVEVSNLSLEPGKHLLSIYARDKVGNESRIESSFIIEGPVSYTHLTLPTILLV